MKTIKNTPPINNFESLAATIQQTNSFFLDSGLPGKIKPEDWKYSSARDWCSHFTSYQFL